MTRQKDANGKTSLSSPAHNATRKLFKNLPVHVFSDAQLPNDSTSGTKAPFYQRPQAGCCLWLTCQFL